MTIRTRPYAPAADGSNTVPDEEATDSAHPSAPDGGPTRPSGSSEILALCLVAADDEDKPLEMPTCILGMDVHPLASLIPGPTFREYRGRREDIQKHGVRHPLVRLKGMLFDGRSTGMACEDLGIVPDIIDLPDGTDAIAYLMSVNVHRRQSILVLSDVAFHRQLVSHSLLAAPGDHHGLRLAIQTPCYVVSEVLDDDRHLLGDVVRVEPDPPDQGLHGIGLVHLGVVVFLAVVSQSPRDLVARVVLQNVEDGGSREVAPPRRRSISSR